VARVEFPSLQIARTSENQWLVVFVLLISMAVGCKSVARMLIKVENGEENWIIVEDARRDGATFSENRQASPGEAGHCDSASGEDLDALGALREVTDI